MNYLLNSLLITSLVSTLCINDTFSQYAIKNQNNKKIKTTSSFTFGDIIANPLKDGSLVESRVSQLALIAFKNSFQFMLFSGSIPQIRKMKRSTVS